MNYNPYFPGGAISMPRVIFDDLVAYDDGTPFSSPANTGFERLAADERVLFRYPRHDLADGQGRDHVLELGR